MSDNDYKYKSDAEFWQGMLSNLSAVLDVFSTSYKHNKWTFVLQTINLVLLVVLVNFLTSPLFDALTKGVEKTNILSLKILVIFLFFIVTTIVSKTFKWQIIFETNRKVTVKYLVILIMTNTVVYLGKVLFGHFYGKTK